MSKRAPLGMARLGATSLNTSGDFAIAFSTSHSPVTAGTPLRTAQFIDNTKLDPLFAAVVEGTEEAILNSLLSAETMTGRDGSRIYAIPHDRLRDLPGIGSH